MNGRGLPDSVLIREVGPRDGFQNEPEVIPTAEKIRLIDLLSATGLSRIEVTSFVRQDVIPQLADSEEVLAGIERRQGVSYSVLIPNGKGFERALASKDRFDEASFFTFAPGEFNASTDLLVVPEPSPALLGGLGMLALLRRRRH